MKSKRLLAPYVAWMTVFTLIPLGVMVYYAFTGSITGQLTLAQASLEVMRVENAELTQAKAELEGALETALATLAQVRALRGQC